MLSRIQCITRRSICTALARIKRKHKVAIVIGFYGGNYSGMQTNDLKTSIEDTLINALYHLGKIEFCNVYKTSKFDWERCSRTDKGVSAKKIVVAGKMLDYDDEFLPTFRNKKAEYDLNHLLPHDIRVFSYTRVSNGFNPHLNSFSRQYSYYLPLTNLNNLGVSININLLKQSLNVFLGTHYMKNFSGSIRHRNKNLKQFYLRTINSIKVNPMHVLDHDLLHIQLVGNSFLYHQIRKMIGASVAVSCGSWTLPYLKSCLGCIHSLFLGFESSPIQVPLVPSTPLVLDSVSFRCDKNIFLNKDELKNTVMSGKKKKNMNPNKLYDKLVLLDDEENEHSDHYFNTFVLPKIIGDIDAMEDFGNRCKTEKVLQYLLNKGLISKENPCGLFIDRSVLEENINEIKKAFPESFFVHHYAVKANPIKSILKVVKENGFGVECASFGEIYNALKAGVSVTDIVYDSPLKLEKDLRYCFEHGIHVNFDNMQEMEMGYQLYRSMQEEGCVVKGHVGLRINSQYGAGTIEATSTVTPTSKFGLPIKDTDFDSLLQMFEKWPELNALHSHVGSQGVDLHLMVQGVRFVVDLAEKINSKLHRKQICVIDIGGGLPVDYKHDASNHIVANYSEQLRKEVPQLFTGDYEVHTEMGRWIIATSGWFVSRIEYTKIAGGVLVGITHAGGNMFVREVYMRDTWYHPITIYNEKGVKKHDNKKIANIAGPLCFSGDLIAKEIELPEFKQGDYMIYHHTAAYSLSMYSKYNCVAAPPAYLYTVDASNKDIEVQLIKKKETVEEISAFWDA